MSLEYALEWLKGPLMGIGGVIDIVSSFIFQFKGVQVRELPRQSDASCINCITALSDGWAVGDDDGHIGVYDLQCEQLLKTYQTGAPVRTIAAFGDDNGLVFNQVSRIIYRHDEDLVTHWCSSHDGRQVFKLVTFPDGLVVSCSKTTTSVHVYTWSGKVFHFMHSLTALHRTTDIVRCGLLLASFHQSAIFGPNVEVWLWDVRRGHHLHTFPLACSYVYHAISLTDSKIALVDSICRLHVYNEEKNAYEVSKVASTLCALPDGELLTTRVHDDNFYILAPGDQCETIVHNQKQSASNYHMSYIFYVPSGHVVVCNGNLQILVYK